MTDLFVEGENDNNSTLEYNPGEQKNDDLIEFLQDNDLIDMKSEILSSKLKLSHFRDVEKSDLDDLCNDLELKPAQKIRLKSAIKALQKSMIRNRIKNKMSNLKNKRLSIKAIKAIKSNNDENDEDDKVNNDEENIRKLKSKVVIVGEAAVGKTTLSKSMMGYNFEYGSKATFAVNSNHHKSSYIYDKYNIKIDYEIFDTPGLDRFNDIITLYLRGALAVIVVYDICNYKSFIKAKYWINYLENNASGYDKIILIANKIDTYIDNDNNNNIDIVKEGRLYATEHGISFLEISAKTKDNVSVLLSWLNKQSKNKVANNPQLINKKDEIIQLHQGNNNKFLDKLDNFNFDYSKCCAF